MSSNRVDIAASREVDAKGQLCPMPIVALAKAMKDLAPGQVLVLYVTDQGAKRDVPAWAAKTGNTLLDLLEEGGVMAFYVQKAA